MRRHYTCILFCSLLTGCTIPDRGTEVLGTGWEMAMPSTVGLDSHLLKKCSTDIGSGALGNVHALVIVRAGKLVYEAYFAGQDELWFEGYRYIEYSPTVKHGLRSVSKSFTAALVGIAIDRGLIDSVDMPLCDALPQYAALLKGEKSRITLRHILTMTAGLRWVEGGKVEDDADDDQYDLQETDDPIGLVLARDLVAEPGSKFNYSGGLTQVLVGVVEHATGMPFLEFADSALFAPLNIENWEWFALGNARPAAWSGLLLTARDMVKLGQIYLDNGKWQGHSIVSRDWIEATFSPEIEAPLPRLTTHITYSGYGFQWWIDSLDWRGSSVALHSAIGNGGQRIVVIPQFGLVLGIFAGFYEDPNAGRVNEIILSEYILPAVQDSASLSDTSKVTISAPSDTENN
jgi:CubicO group peptidase (beta-lactamase class C family)